MSFIFSSLSYANCGEGKITSLMEGGWNTDNFFIQLDSGSDWIVYVKDELSEERFSGIKALAISAFLASKSVSPLSHNNNCSRATELSIYK